MKSITNSFSFVYSGKPESYNADAKKKKIYQRKIANTFKRQYSGMIANGDLYALIYYFYKEDKQLDTDNLSKPVWDALNTHAYTDDNQIKIRSTISIDLRKHDLSEFNQDMLSNDDLYDLMDSIYDNDHTVYILVGKIEDYNNIFSIHTLWN